METGPSAGLAISNTPQFVSTGPALKADIRTSCGPHVRARFPTRREAGTQLSSGAAFLNTCDTESPGSKTQVPVSAQQMSDWALKPQGEAEMTSAMAGGHSAQGHRHSPKSQEACSHCSFAGISLYGFDPSSELSSPVVPTSAEGNHLFLTERQESSLH